MSTFNDRILQRLAGLAPAAAHGLSRCLWAAALLGCLTIGNGCHAEDGTASSSPSNEAAAKVPASAEAARTLAGTERDPFAAPKGIKVLVFLGIECPISNRYAPELRRLHEQFASRGVEWWMVYPGTNYPVAELEQHQRSYRLPGNPLVDPSLYLVKKSQARVTPEAAVYVDGRLLYHGRIDDRFPKLGVERREPTQRDLEEVLTATLAGRKPASAETTAVGCFIQGLP